MGGGMLALPVLTSPGGFVPSIFLYVACWLFMTLTGLLFLELSLQMEDGVNFVTMAERTLGKGGKAFAWGLYLFLFYCLMVAYIVGCGDILSAIFPIPRWFGPLAFTMIFSPFVYFGTELISKLNYLFMGIFFLLYAVFVVIGLPYVDIQNLERQDWGLSLLALPVAFVAFAYQGIIPTLSTYLHHDKRKIAASIWIGTFIPFLMYILWQWLILGIIPFEGYGGLKEALLHGHNAVAPLKNALNNSYIYHLGQYFAFFALMTSFLGVALGLKDFLADGLNIKKTPKGKIMLLGTIIIPPLVIAVIYPDIFLKALDIAGGYGSALLLGLLPILMVAKWRYDNPQSMRIVPGGYLLLAVMALFVLFEVAIELSKLYRT